MQQSSAEIRREKWLNGLLFFLFCSDVSAVALAVAFGPRLDNFSWNSGNPLSYWWNSRDRAAIPGVVFAAVILSIGVYFFVRTCLVLRDERRAELKAAHAEANQTSSAD